MADVAVLGTGGWAVPSRGDCVVAALYVNYQREAFLNAGADVAMSVELVSRDMRPSTDLARPATWRYSRRTRLQ